MRIALKIAILAVVAAPVQAQRPWQEITVPGLRDVAAKFQTPPREYGAIGTVRLPLVLCPYEAKFIVVGPSAAGAGAPEPSFASGETVTELSGDWKIDLNGKTLTTPMKSWEGLGSPSFAGPAMYRKEFTAAGAPAGKRMFLELLESTDM